MAQGGDERPNERPNERRGERHGGRRRGGPGGFPDFAEFADFGRNFADFGRHFGGGPRGRRGPRVGRGDVRAGILILLAEEPRNGYQIIQELEHRSDGVWRPSPGSIYPALSQLEDEGLIEQIESSGESKRLFQLTDAGTAYVASHQEELKPPWEALTGSVRGGMFELRDLLGQTAFAAIQVARAGTDAQVAAARTLLDETRRGLYRILADGDVPTADDDPADDSDTEQ
jgi:DNA-binding PadR family transcriptional regulator